MKVIYITDSSTEIDRRNTSIWVLTSFVFLTSFRFMSSFAFLNFFVGLTSLDFELFWCLMLFVLFCFMTSFVLWTLSKEICAIFDLFYLKFFRSFLLLLSYSFCIYVLYFYDFFQILIWHHFQTLILLAEHREGGWYQSCYNSKATKQWISDRGWRRQGDERGPQEDRAGVVKAWRRL